ncbi:hypothetical protein KFL_012360020 [Klebsormidium nitens]|uniref:Uncharacterized protein n=1 Tax=Klebsormidium nitens TaxID=105231 RepID=A0A1Y1IW81_KLENI|nr:hypothetical protein KFL_012360020 [Klebsormidium nitens]|eukprot:GAQ92987.1 hypothetical protein KFL_012360020 [Klebsormidium nitens]
MLRAEENAEGMSVICQPRATWEDTCLLVREAESPVLWHRRLGHAGYESLAKMVEGPGLVRGVGVKAGAFREEKTLVCEPCIMGKQTRKPFPKESDSKESTEPLELVHMDVCGPMPRDGATDHGGALSRTKRFGGGAVEPDARGKSAGFAGLGPELWAEAMVTANYTWNQVPSSVHGKTPWEMFYGEKPNLSHLRVFGARAYIHVPKGNRKKMEPVSERGVFLGYEPNSKSYRVLRERDGRILTSRDVMVDERGPSAIVELGSDPGKEGGACGPSRVSPPTWMGVGGSGEHPEPQTYQEAVGGEESELWRMSMDEEMRSLLENGTWELVKKTGGGEAGSHEVGLQD